MAPIVLNIINPFVIVKPLQLNATLDIHLKFQIDFTQPKFQKTYAHVEN